MHAFRRGRSLVAAAALVSGLAAALPTSHASIVSLAEQVAAIAPPPAFDHFLNRLMAAESGGRSDAKNPRSTALGPFQFIKTTFLDITRRHFPEEIAGLSEAQILERRRDPELSRRAATAYCKESVTYLQAHGLEPTFAHLRTRLSAWARRRRADHACGWGEAGSAAALARCRQGQSVPAKHAGDRSSGQERARCDGRTSVIACGWCGARKPHPSTQGVDATRPSAL